MTELIRMREMKDEYTLSPGRGTFLRRSLLVLASRIFLVVLCILADFAIGDHEPDPSVRRFEGRDDFSRFARRWDSAQFLEIAESGYEEQAQYAFFPLFPILVRHFCRVLTGGRVDVAWCGVILNAIASVFAAHALAELTVLVYYSSSKKDKENSAVVKKTKNQELLLRDKIFFLVAFNPASIFFLVNYSESLFACLFFTALWQLERGSWVLAAVFFHLASWTRANGILAIIIVVLHAFTEAVRILFHDKKGVVWPALTRLFCSYTITIVAIVTPYAAVQWTAYERYCAVDITPRSSTTSSAATSTSSRTFETPPPWCDWQTPSVYAYVQQKVWNNGFLAYWQFRQIPNFLLASPLLWVLGTHYSRLWADFRMAAVGGESSRGTKTSSTKLSLLSAQVDRLLAQKETIHILRRAEYDIFMLIFVLFIVTTAHVQIVTRAAFASCPAIYWILLHFDEKNHNIFGFSATWFWTVLYIVLGVVLHSNFLPWT
ncbi:unnamed protein product [Amoebophrya sp. A25]|nr:unnamed protein product [Amoebophrya sp. A25]|eukprot:GSA25T00012725001.1